MKLETYIAIVLVSIFLGKFIALDANGLNLLFSDSDISFVKPNCKKENPPKRTKQSVNFSQLDLSTVQSIVISGECTTQFQFELFTWETNIPEPQTVFNEHFSSRLNYRYLDNASPPPRQA